MCSCIHVWCCRNEYQPCRQASNQTFAAGYLAAEPRPVPVPDSTWTDPPAKSPDNEHHWLKSLGWIYGVSLKLSHTNRNCNCAYLARWRWNDSREVVPLAQRSTGNSTPPLVMCPVTVYRATPGGSWMHARCFFSTSQMATICSLSTGTPRESVAVESFSSSSSISCKVNSLPLVLLRQWRASSSLVMAFFMALMEGLLTPSCCRHPLFASHRRLNWHI